mgnify:FL=1
MLILGEYLTEFHALTQLKCFMTILIVHRVAFGDNSAPQFAETTHVRELCSMFLYTI